MKTKHIIKKGLLLISVSYFRKVVSSFLEEEKWTSPSQLKTITKQPKGYEIIS